MNHPTKEELMAHLYADGIEHPTAKLTEQHVAQCAACREQLEVWRAVQQDLSAWKTVPVRTRRIIPIAVYKWAAAAAVLLLVGFGLGRMGGPRIDATQLRADLRNELMQQVEGEIAAARAADRREFIQMLRDVEEERISDYAQLRKDLETVAVVADQKLTTTEEALHQLRFVAQAASPQTSQ